MVTREHTAPGFNRPAENFGIYVISQKTMNEFYIKTDIRHNVTVQHPVALLISEFVFCFDAGCVQRQLTFSYRFLFVVTTCFGLTDHLLAYRLLWFQNLLLTVMLFCFCYVEALDCIWLCGLVIFFFYLGVLELGIFVVLWLAINTTNSCPSKNIQDNPSQAKPRNIEQQLKDT